MYPFPTSFSAHVTWFIDWYLYCLHHHFTWMSAIAAMDTVPPLPIKGTKLRMHLDCSVIDLQTQRTLYNNTAPVVTAFSKDMNSQPITPCTADLRRYTCRTGHEWSMAPGWRSPDLLSNSLLIKYEVPTMHQYMCSLPISSDGKNSSMHS